MNVPLQLKLLPQKQKQNILQDDSENGQIKKKSDKATSSHCESTHFSPDSWIFATLEIWQTSPRAGYFTIKDKHPLSCFFTPDTG